MTEEERITFGFNVYCWGEQYQDALLIDCILPLFSRLTADCDAHRLWFDRATLRGPHIFGLVTVPVRHQENARDLIRVKLERFLCERPSQRQLTAQELNASHLDAGGKSLCDADLEDGIGANNSFKVFIHEGPDTRYPFFLWKEDNLFWRITAGLTMFILRQLAAGVKKNRLALVALIAFDKVFFEDSGEAKQYWTYHLSTLIPRLDVSRLGSSHVQAMLGHTISEEGFAQILQWRNGHVEDEMADSFTEIEEFFRDLQPVVGKAAGSARSVARELLHVLLKQLGISTLRQIPIIFSLLALSTDVQVPVGHR
jgi:hypothetical protein